MTGYGEFILVYCIWKGAGEICENKSLRLDRVFESEKTCELYAKSQSNREYILENYKGYGKGTYIFPGCQGNPFGSDPTANLG